MVPDLGHLAPAPQPGKRQRRIHAGDEDQVHLGRLVFGQEPDCLVDPLVLDEMVVVEHEEEGGRAGCHIVDQLRDQVLSLAGYGRLQLAQRPAADFSVTTAAAPQRDS